MSQKSKPNKKDNKNTNPAVETKPVKIYNFCKLNVVIVLSVILLLVSVAGSFILKPNVAIEFKGGTIISYYYSGEKINTSEAKSAIESVISESVKVTDGESLDDTRSDFNRTITIKLTSNTGLNAEEQIEVSAALKEKFADRNFSPEPDSSAVNASIGREFFLKCIVAVLLAALLIIVYIAFRFRNIGGWSAGICSILALIFNSVVIYAVFVMFGFEIDSNFMAVILTILGYSINNTIVVYDRIRENKVLMPRTVLREIVDTSCTQSLTRSLRTSLMTVLPMVIVSIVVFINGYYSLLNFSVPMIFGIVSGAYSSLFVATSIWVWWMEKTGKDKPKTLGKKNTVKKKA